MAVSRKIFALFIMALVMASFSVPAVAQLPVKKPGTIKEQIANSTLFNGDKLDKDILDILDYASKFKGTRYLLGATGPNRFDCSGFTSYVFSKFGYRLQRTSREQVNDGKVIAKKPLREYGMKESEIESFAVSVEKSQQRLLNQSYVKFSIEEMMEIYRALY